MKFTISCRNLFKYSSKLVKYWRYGSKSMKEVTLYVDLLICTFCRGSNMTGYFPFPSRVGSRPRYGFSFCMVCTRGPRHSPVSWSVRLSSKARFPNVETSENYQANHAPGTPLSLQLDREMPWLAHKLKVAVPGRYRSLITFSHRESMGLDYGLYGYTHSHPRPVASSEFVNRPSCNR